MKKKPIVIIGVLALVVIGIIMNNFLGDTSQPIIDNQTKLPNIDSRIIVQINGEVKRPGIYEMNQEDRINDLIIVAGGLTSKADLNNINLVAKLSDGMVILISAGQKTNNENIDKISINDASLEQLMTLTGIGEARARNIINYRQEKGRFMSLSDLLNVTGISENIFNNIREDICL